jgi:hypothetical protein
MKTNTLLKITAALVVGLLAISAFGQGPAITVTIPFGFHAGDRSYAAGNYALSSMHDNVLTLANDGRNTQALFLVARVIGRRGVDPGAQVRFQCYAAQCFLSQIWIPGIDGGFEIQGSKAEKELKVTMTGNYLALVAKPARR